MIGPLNEAMAAQRTADRFRVSAQHARALGARRGAVVARRRARTILLWPRAVLRSRVRVLRPRV